MLVLLLLAVMARMLLLLRRLGCQQESVLSPQTLQHLRPPMATPLRPLPPVLLLLLPQQWSGLRSLKPGWCLLTPRELVQLLALPPLPPVLLVLALRRDRSLLEQQLQLVAAGLHSCSLLLQCVLLPLWLVLLVSLFQRLQALVQRHCHSLPGGPLPLLQAPAVLLLLLLLLLQVVELLQNCQAMWPLHVAQGWSLLTWQGVPLLAGAGWLGLLLLLLPLFGCCQQLLPVVAVLLLSWLLGPQLQVLLQLLLASLLLVLALLLLLLLAPLMLVLRTGECPELLALMLVVVLLLQVAAEPQPQTAWVSPAQPVQQQPQQSCS